MSDLRSFSFRNWVAWFGDQDAHADEGGPALPHRALIAAQAGKALTLYSQNQSLLPSVTMDGQSVIIFDGVLYRDCIDSVVRCEEAKVLDNAQVLLLAYQQHGAEIFAELRGLFALLIWDFTQNSLYFLRDPTGWFPLFYARVPGGWFISPYLDTLRAHPRVSKEINRAALAEHLYDFYLRPAETAIRDVFRLFPGHVAVLQPGQSAPQTQRYWHAKQPGVVVEWIENDVVEQFQFQFDKVIRRFASLGQSSVFLSGGLDSVSVAVSAVESSAAQKLPPPLGLSIWFPDQDLDESGIQRQVADGLGMPLSLLTIQDLLGAENPFTASLVAARTAPLPLFNIWLPL